jgi:hypothetical protein
MTKTHTQSVEEIVMAEFDKKWPNTSTDYDVWRAKEEARKEMKNFIIDALTQAVEKERDKVGVILCRLLREFANTPLDARESGWHWLLKAKDEILKALNPKL